MNKETNFKDSVDERKKVMGLTLSVVVICLAVVLIWQSGMFQQDRVAAAIDQNKTVPVKTMKVVHPRPVTHGSLITLPGRARAATQATLFFRVSAPLIQVHARTGERVEKGDLLLELDDRDFKHQVSIVQSKLASATATLLKLRTGARPEDVRIIQSSLAAAQADLALAQKELERHEILYQNQAVSEQAYDRAKTNVLSLGARKDSLEEQLARDTGGARKEDIMAAQAAVGELEARLAVARDQLSDTRLYAPFGGVVTQRFIEAHEMAVQGQPVMTLDDISVLEIPVDVPENLVSILLKATSPEKSDQYSARFLTHEDGTYPARLTEYSSRADQAIGTYEFVFTLTPDPKDLVFPGMTAEIRLMSGSQTDFSQDWMFPFRV